MFAIAPLKQHVFHTACDRQTDRQTGMSPIAKSRSNIAERDKSGRWFEQRKHVNPYDVGYEIWSRKVRGRRSGEN